MDIVDAHHHFFDPSKNSFSAFLHSLGVPPYLPGDYYDTDAAGINILKSVHVEAIPDDGLAEAAWVEHLIAAGRAPSVCAIVAACDLSRPDADAHLQALAATCPHLRGIRHILDYDGVFDGGKTNATHVAVSRHNIDYLRDASGVHRAAFERGFALLAKHNLSFDLQCCPAQLSAAAALCARHPSTRVVIDHLGKVRHLQADGSESDRAKLKAWQEGLELMAALPNVYVKISMLGFAVPGWWESPAKEEQLRRLVLQVIDLFSPQRCMFASNWHVNGAASNSDGVDATGPRNIAEMYASFSKWVAHYSESDRKCLFVHTASKFYNI